MFVSVLMRDVRERSSQLNYSPDVGPLEEELPPRFENGGFAHQKTWQADVVQSRSGNMCQRSFNAHHPKPPPPPPIIIFLHIDLKGAHCIKKINGLVVVTQYQVTQQLQPFTYSDL